MSGYDRDELRSLLSDGWRGDDYALFRYKPARFQRGGYNAATQLVLDFKNNLPAARDEVLAWCLGTIANLEDDLRAQRDLRHVVAVPRSVAGAPNEPCEWVAAHIVAEVGWLTHLPQALVRTESITPAHKAAVRPTIDDQRRTMRYAGPPLEGKKVVEGLYCHACRKQFQTANGLDWHITNNRDHAKAAAKLPAGGGGGAVLMLDDVITRGATSQACRDLLLDAGAQGAVGFFVARTG